MSFLPSENTVVGVVPDSLISNAGWAVKGTSSAIAALSDSNSNTYVEADSLSDDLKAGFGPYVGVPPLSQLRTVVVRALVEANGQANVQYRIFIAGTELSGQVWASSYPALRDWNSTNFLINYFPTQQAIDDLYMQMTVAAFTMGANRVAVGETALYLLFNQAPTVSNVRPTAYGTSPGLPVTWEYSDPENNVQEWSYVKAIPKAQYEGVGFDPDSSAGSYSQEVKSSAKSRIIPFLTDDRYRIYVKAADVDSWKRYGPWSYTEIEVRNRYIQSIV